MLGQEFVVETAGRIEKIISEQYDKLMKSWGHRCDNLYIS